MQNYFALSDYAAREAAYWYPIYGKFESCYWIKVQNLNEDRTEYNNISENLRADASRVFLRTRYAYEYTPSSYIYYRDKWYQIENITMKNYPTMGLFPILEYVFQLVEVNYGRDFQSKT